jgi:hypothetical protein
VPKTIPNAGKERATPWVFAGIALLSLATLTFEISLTRVFSLSQGYHFAFMVVSIALLGLGAAGSLLMARPSLLKVPVYSFLQATAIGFSVSSLVSFIGANQIPFDPVRISWDQTQLLFIMFYYLLLATPLFFTGLALAAVLSRFPERVHTLYFSDLTGAGCGCLLVLAVLAIGGSTAALGVVPALGLVSSLCFGITSVRGRLISSTLLVLFFLFAAAFGKEALAVRISPYQPLMVALRQPMAKHLITRWNAFSRVDVVESSASRSAPGLSLNYLDPLPAQLGITIDGDRLSAVTRYDGNVESLEFTSFLPSAAPYAIKHRNHGLVLRALGGLDMLTALRHGAKDVEAVESNPSVIQLFKEDLSSFSGNLYGLEGVTVWQSESRSFLRRSKKRYDLIHMSLSDVLGASSTGNYGLIEDYLLTEEAFVEYLSHLTESGVLSITSYLLPPPRQEVRLVSLCISSLKRLGIPHPKHHIMALRSVNTMTLLLKRGQVDEDEIRLLKRFCTERSFDLVYYPGITPQEVNIFNRMKEPTYFNIISALLEENSRQAMYENYLYDIRAVTDDAPFFYHFFRLDKVGQVYRSVDRKWTFFLEGGYLVPVVFLQALIVSVLLIILPIFFTRRKGEKGLVPRSRGFLLLFYFFGIGISFMLVEITLIQRFILFLDHPAYAISLVLFGILVFSGLGSLLSQKYSASHPTTLIGVLPTLSLLIILFLFGMPYLFRTFLPLPLFQRQCLTLVFLAPLALFMGVTFPLGIRWLQGIRSTFLPWAWCINGCASVLSSVLAVLIALAWGFQKVLVIAAASYGVAFVCLIMAALKAEQSRTDAREHFTG